MNRNQPIIHPDQARKLREAMANTCGKNRALYEAVSATKKAKLPPFGKVVLELNPRPSEILIVMGSQAWEFSKTTKKPCLVLPPGEHPAVYRWPVAGIDCLVFERGESNESRLLELIKALLHAGSPTVRAINHSKKFAVFHRESPNV